ncbi:hypothetical protein HPB52_008419 [Rhipicephalus sanguineus]|uniref:Uncharacterized protein n=1 Tax=Rhipicephalus sanguineus TaxID=34632 RepID=A0A9D4Q5L4_RHISA|nr:hypothetical protein HPB52_008419 [Rhipicephalus sanguineus]
MKQTGGNEACREAGGTVVVKSSEDSGGEVSAMAQNQAPEDVSAMSVIVRDAQTDTNTPLSITVHVNESPLPLKAVEMRVFGEVVARGNQDASPSSSSSSSEEEEESSSTSESSSSSDAPSNQAHAKDYLTPEAVKQQMIAQYVQKPQMQRQQLLMNMTPKE